MPGTLFVVATPIGNLEDITVRALRVLREVALIAAEDTRRTAHLLARYAITTPTTSLHEHNEAAEVGVARRAAAARREHRAGVGCGHADDFRSRAALDSRGDRRRDPRRADSRAERRAWPRWPRPGLPTDAFTFLGFPPTRSKDRKQWFERLRAVGGTVVFFEAPHRIRRTLERASAQSSATVQVVVGRELTKIHEELVRGPISAVSERLDDDRGEFTVVVDIGHTTRYQSRAEPLSRRRSAAEFGRYDQSMTV